VPPFFSSSNKVIARIALAYFGLFVVIYSHLRTNSIYDEGAGEERRDFAGSGSGSGCVGIILSH
jgi:hypothetical protein